MGGYLVARGAAFEHCASAIVLNDGVYDFGSALRTKTPSPSFLERISCYHNCMNRIQASHLQALTIMTSTQPKTRLFAGATLLDTPVISAALEFARIHHDTMTYNHTYRSWIFGTILEFANIDFEVHAVSAILHDLAWDYRSVFSSPEKRFEVDGANAAIDFLNHEAPYWDDRRRQLVWDSIALHTTTSIARYKEPEVALCNMGTFADFTGAKFLHDFKEGVKKIMCGLCLHKPETWD